MPPGVILYYIAYLRIIIYYRFDIIQGGLSMENKVIEEMLKESEKALMNKPNKVEPKSYNPEYVLNVTGENFTKDLDTNVTKKLNESDKSKEYTFKNNTKRNVTIVGTKYYRYNGDELEIIRIQKIKNENCFLVRYEQGGPENKGLPNTKNFVKMTKAELGTFTKLASDAVIIFNIVTLGNSEDVVVNIMRRKDIENHILFSYAICRQNVKDLFEFIITGDWNKTGVGICISKDTIPAGCDYKQLFKVSNILKKDFVNAYIGDTLDDILSFVNPLNYNDTLKKIKNTAVKYYEIINEPIAKGYCTSLGQLLESNHFGDELDRALEITKVPMSLAYTKETNKLSSEDIIAIADIIGFAMHDTFVVKYDKTIDLKNISYDYKLLRDKHNQIYIVTYSDKQDALPTWANSQDYADIIRSFYLSKQ